MIYDWKGISCFALSKKCFQMIHRYFFQGTKEQSCLPLTVWLSEALFSVSSNFSFKRHGEEICCTNFSFGCFVRSNIVLWTYQLFCLSINYLKISIINLFKIFFFLFRILCILYVSCPVYKEIFFSINGPNTKIAGYPVQL